jgi:ABC-type nitrate/sulfonate/bicarbonate transport system ATPase subunit
MYLDAHYRPVQALADITLAVKRGEFVSIIGPSGCGKSTLLRLAAGLETASSGQMLDGNKPITGPDPERGFVFQSYNAFPWLTVRRNVSFGLRARKSDGQEKRIAKWLDDMGLSEFADSYPKALSGGMRQRLAIARTMIVEPKLLLMDEPFGALDEPTREAMQQLLLRVVSESGCTVLFVTHDIREAILLSDRVLVLSHRPGRILKSFAPALPKPRTRSHLRTPEFNSMYEAIVDSFPVASQAEIRKGSGTK